jgi:hypothetical protein
MLGHDASGDHSRPESWPTWSSWTKIATSRPTTTIEATIVAVRSRALPRGPSSSNNTVVFIGGSGPSVR